MSDEEHPAKEIEGIEMLSEPLVTEEGFLNEACISQLEAAIRNMPESWERLAHEPEWNTPAIIADVEIIGYLAGNAVRAFQGVPPKLEEVVGYAHACLLKGPFVESPDYGGFRMVKLSLCDINRLLWEYLGGLTSFDNWNKEEIVGSRWIDLSALLHQVCISVRNERRHSRAFDIKFERAHGSFEDEE